MEHTFDYALYPHTGSWQSGHLPQIAEAYSHPCMKTQSNPMVTSNIPFDSLTESKPNAKFPLIEIDKPNVLISALKFSESDIYLVEKATSSTTSSKTPTGFICRIYECEGRNTKFHLILKNIFPSLSISEFKIENLDLLEDPITSENEPNMGINKTDHPQGWLISLKIKPYEIITLGIYHK
ncbi:MAG: glycosyl hydrolase-related protein [Promethearchaeota archaeon]